jgi:3-hydroxymyristoyl/3-hydroxydecanoyl-(acyl carrier protein) dehydratase
MVEEADDFASATLRALASDLEVGCGDVRRDGDEITATVPVVVLERLCRGHFPGAPMVPGAYLLGLLLDLARLVDASATIVERCVFRSQVAPTTPVTLAARRGARGRVVAEVRVGAERPAVAWFVGAGDR